MATAAAVEAGLYTKIATLGVSSASPDMLAARPQPAGDPAGELQQRITSAIKSGTAELVVPPGEYHFGNRTLLVEDATDFR